MDSPLRAIHLTGLPQVRALSRVDVPADGPCSAGGLLLPAAAGRDSLRLRVGDQLAVAHRGVSDGEFVHTGLGSQLVHSLSAIVRSAE